MDPYIGRVLGGSYEILSLLGQGATTSVYKAKDTKHDRFAAVKILHFQFGSNEGTVNRFQQETKTISRLNHVNIAAYYDSGITDEDEYYLVLEYADGVNLKQMLQQSGALKWKRAIGLFMQICAALGAAHQNGIVHRDLKPANIIITRDEHGNELVKLLDFGVAKLLIQGETFQTKTQTGEMLGTLLYMSPEQCLDQDLDARSDIYSLGCVLFEALTGNPPFAARTAFETMNLHLTGLPEKLSKVRPELSFPKQLDGCIQKAMAKDPKRRYQTIAAFAEDLSKIDKDLPLALESNSNIATISLDAQDKKRIRGLQITIASFVIGILFLLFGLHRANLAFGAFIPFLLCMYLGAEEYKSMKKNRAADKPPQEKKVTTAKNTMRNDNLISRNNFEIEKFAQTVFDRVDLNRDGFITQFEMKEILKDNRSNLTLHHCTFIQFVLDHYSDFEEIFDNQGKRVGISKEEICEFARNIQDS